MRCRTRRVPILFRRQQRLLQRHRRPCGQVLRLSFFSPGAMFQAVAGRVHEASTVSVANSTVFVANSTAFGISWANAHLLGWRRNLGQKCAGIGMTGIIEGAERLVKDRCSEGTLLVAVSLSQAGLLVGLLHFQFYAFSPGWTQTFVMNSAHGEHFL